VGTTPREKSMDTIYVKLEDGELIELGRWESEFREVTIHTANVTYLYHVKTFNEPIESVIVTDANDFVIHTAKGE
jgi:hypothetical protein